MYVIPLGSNVRASAMVCELALRKSNPGGIEILIAYYKVLLSNLLLSIGYGVTANITASHAVARGSIPRIGVFLK